MIPHQRQFKAKTMTSVKKQSEVIELIGPSIYESGTSDDNSAREKIIQKKKEIVESVKQDVERQVKMSRLNLDSQVIIPHQEDVIMTIKSLDKAQRKMPLIRARHKSYKQSLRNNSQS